MKDFGGKTSTDWFFFLSCVAVTYMILSLVFINKLILKVSAFWNNRPLLSLELFYLLISLGIFFYFELFVMFLLRWSIDSYASLVCCGANFSFTGLFVM